MIRVIIENKIPYIKGLLDNICRVKYLEPEDITPLAMSQADALITRTRTRCNAQLLNDSPCRFIATATIGTDHIDFDYCNSHGITVANAPGCNAPAVAQYTISSIANWLQHRNDTRALSNITLGIIGVGNVGKIVEQWARIIGMRVLLCDPPRAEKECTNNFVSSLEIAQQSDIITFHTPHIVVGRYPTHHLCDETFINATTRRPLIINCARGPITDTQALITAIDSEKIADVIIDCWENEPCISETLLDRAFIATPHIAGYSREGKIRATAMAVNALTKHFKLPQITMSETVPMGAVNKVSLQSIAQSYDPMVDTFALKSSPKSFETLRNNYNYRNEVK